jgi:cysteine desulfurase/selenocysteine lyase
MSNIDWTVIRNKYPIFKERTYLRTNGGGPLSSDYTEALAKAATDAQYLGRIWEEYWDYQQQARTLVSEMLNCEQGEVAFSHSVSLTINHLVHMFPTTLRVLTFQDEYPSNTIPFLENGFDVNFIDSDDDGNIHFEEIESAAENADVIVVSHVEYRTGYRHDLEKIGRLCRERGIIFVVDATQSAGVLEIDFKSINADAVVFSTHKWLNAGYSMACMLISKNITSKYTPKIVGWRSVDFREDHSLENYDLKNDASVFELGHPDFISIYAFIAQLELISSLGINNIENRITKLRVYLETKCSESGIAILNNYEDKNKSGMIILDLTDDQIVKLKDNNVDFTHRDNRAMFAISYYNSSDDIDRMIQLL